MTDHAEPPDSDDPLAHVIDDEAARTAARKWCTERMIAGESPDDLVPQLIENGWSSDDAELIVEEVRRETRALRGVRTREDVSREAARHYQRGMRGPMLGFPAIAAVVRLYHGIRSLLTLRRRRDSRK
jgi:hypothetical protein